MAAQAAIHASFSNRFWGSENVQLAKDDALTSPVATTAPCVDGRLRGHDVEGTRCGQQADPARSRNSGYFSVFKYSMIFLRSSIRLFFRTWNSSRGMLSLNVVSLGSALSGNGNREEFTYVLI